MIRPLLWGSLLASLLVGCATFDRTTPPAIPAEVGADTVPETPIPPEIPIPVTRQGRYTLVEILPDTAERDLLRQMVEVRIPNPQHATVGDALRHVLLRSGYLLCPDKEIALLDTLPLPAAHYRIGPMPLDDALRMLAGVSWILDVDERNRLVCFFHTLPLKEF
jgi:type IV pili sensor histidine kinase/response regulator